MIDEPTALLVSDATVELTRGVVVRTLIFRARRFELQVVLTSTDPREIRCTISPRQAASLEVIESDGSVSAEEDDMGEFRHLRKDSSWCRLRCRTIAIPEDLAVTPWTLF